MKYASRAHKEHSTELGGVKAALAPATHAQGSGTAEERRRGVEGGVNERKHAYTYSITAGSG